MKQRDFLIFLMALSFIGFSQSIVDATFNNFLNETFKISNFQRSFLELPREIPGLLVVFFSVLLSFLCSTRLAAAANFLTAFGIIFVAFFSVNFSVMLLWLFVFSVGQHLFLPLNSSIGMALAKEGEAGKRLGQQGGINALAAVLGSLFVTLGFRYLGFQFKYSFLVAGLGYLMAAILILRMRRLDEPHPIRERLKLKKEYALYYWITVLFGTRKQIFLTFAPWVLVTVFHRKTEWVAFLLTIGGTIGIFFRPVLGRWIDRYGERKILSLEAFLLIFVCLGYGFSKQVFSEDVAFVLASTCYMLDQLLMAFGMARATYLKRIALHPSDIPNTLTMGTSIDHIFSISIALLGGGIWVRWGYPAVFLIGALISVINLISVSFIPSKK